MIIDNLTESRRSPDKNPKQSIYQFLLPYKSDPDVYIHTTNVDKVGIYPRSPEHHDSPLGIYAYRLVDVWDDYVERWNTGDYADRPRGLSMLPYYGGDYTFVLRATTPVITAESYTQEQLDSDIAKIVDWYELSPGELKSVKSLAKTNLNFRSSLPVSMLWAITKTLVGEVTSDGFDEHTRVDVKKWNHLLRRLGYTAFSDSGYGFIHGAEGSQAVFLTGTAYKVINKHHKFRKKEFKLGSGKSLQSIPKRLKMQSIPNTFFYNNRPSEFTRVVEWHVNSMNMSDFREYLKFLPKAAHGSIQTLSFSGSDIGVVRRVSNELNLVASANRVEINTVYLGINDWFSVYQILMKFPDSTNIQQIAVSKWLGIGEEYLKRLPESVARKLIFV